jgi:hypothetical protein
MAQSGYTPILLYASGTTGHTPTAANLTSGTTGAELALNYYDGILFFKNASGTVTTLASANAAAGIFVGTGAVTLPAGTTAQEPSSPVEGMIRYNTTTKQFEGYSEVASVAGWYSVGGSSITNDTTTATAVYPLFAHATSGTAQVVYTSNANYLYTPSTGQLQAPEIYASNGVISMANMVTQNTVVPSGANVVSIGPWGVTAGVTFTLQAGSRQVII